MHRKTIKNLSGNTYGALRVVRPVGWTGGKYLWVCECACGETVHVSHSKLVTKTVVSCGGCDYKKYYKKQIPDSQTVRASREYIEFISLVKERDRYKCIKCGSGKKIEVHHICDVNRYASLSCDVNNGVCLCAVCHKKYHLDYLMGYHNESNRSLFDEWLKQER